MKKASILFFALFFFVKSGNSQEHALDSLLDAVILGDEQLDWLFEEERRKTQFLYARTLYSNNTQYAGREIGTDQFNLRSDILYFNEVGLFGSLSTAWYSQLDPKLNSIVLSAGYGSYLKKMKSLRWRVSANKFFFTDQDFTPTYQGGIAAGLTLRRKWVSVRADYSLFVGQETSSQLTLGTYTKFTLLKLGSHGKIQLRPTINFLIAPETVITESTIFNPRFPDFQVFTEEEVTGLLNSQISIPLTINYKNFDFQVSYRYNVPRSLDPLYTYENSSQINVSLGYLINLSR